jgi:hypothetical protein
MKKNKLYFIGVLVCTVLILAACAKSKADRCDELSTAWSNAATAFGTTPSASTCEDYLNKLQDYMDGCAKLTPSERASLQSSIDNTDCSIFGK